MESLQVLSNSLSDLEVLSLTLYGECRGERIEGIVAVGMVIKNRRKNNTYKDVCLAPKQFSCWNENDPNYPILIELAQKLVLSQEIDERSFIQCRYVAWGIISDSLYDNTYGAVNYLTGLLFNSDNRPDWAKSPKNITRIGNHVFFNV